MKANDRFAQQLETALAGNLANSSLGKNAQFFKIGHLFNSAEGRRCQR